MFSVVISCIFFSFFGTRNTGQCLPPDLKPNLLLTEADTEKLPLFTGRGQNAAESLDLQDIKVIDARILIGSRNAAFVVSQSSFTQATGNIPYDQLTSWNPLDRELCMNKKSDINICQNFIRIISLVATDQILMCGTNAGDPKCRKYSWSGLELSRTYLNEPSIEKGLVPYSDKDSITYLFSNNCMFCATKLAFRSNLVLNRVEVIKNESSRTNSTANLPPAATRLPPLNIEKNRWFNSPTFVGMFEDEEKVFLFFKEEAKEASDQTDKVVFSRVSQVCKGDTGGGVNVLTGRWTSFFKARLNCSLAGSRPLYFNEIQHIFGPVSFDGNPTIFATFTTPESHLPGSAVCAFSVNSIKSAMNGRFQDQTSGGSCGKKLADDPPSPSKITSCQSIKDQETLRYIKSHQLLFDVVSSIDDRAIFTSIQTDVRFTSIAVETVRVNGANVSVLYVGTQKGSLLKITINQIDSNRTKANDFRRQVVFNEEWKVYQPRDCGKNKSETSSSSTSFSSEEENKQSYVRNITILSDFVLVSFQRCVVSVPKKACWRYTCKSSCVQSGNPHCGWQNGECVPVVDGSNPEQNLFGEKVYEDGACSDAKEIQSGSSTCSGSISVSVFVIVIAVIIILFLLIIFYVQYSYRRKFDKLLGTNSGLSHHNKKSEGRLCFGRRSNGKAPSITVAAASPIKPSFHESAQPCLNENNSNKYKYNVNVSLRPTFTGRIAENNLKDQYMSGDDTTWSEDLSCDGPLATDYCQDCASLDGGTLFRREPDCSRCEVITDDVKCDQFKLSCVESHHSHSTFSSEQKNSVILQRNNSSFLPNAENARPNLNLPGSNFLPVATSITKTNQTGPADSTEKTPTTMATFLSKASSVKTQTTNRKTKCPMTFSSYSTSTDSSSCVDLEFVASDCTQNSQDTFLDPNKVLSSHDTFATPSPEPSLSSGFVSCSSQVQNLDESFASRKACIVAKGILSAQSTLASPKLKGKRRKRKQKESKPDETDCASEASSFAEKICESLLTSSDVSPNNEKSKNFSFLSPEFVYSSDEENKKVENSSLISKNPLELSKAKKSSFAFRSLKTKREKTDWDSVNDENFKSPAYDEKLFVPKLEGWQEIDYDVTSVATLSRGKFVDDSVMRANDDTNRNQFFTLRPRARQKISERKWDLKNHLLHVPTPEIPNPL